MRQLSLFDNTIQEFFAVDNSHDKIVSRTAIRLEEKGFKIISINDLGYRDNFIWKIEFSKKMRNKGDFHSNLVIHQSFDANGMIQVIFAPRDQQTADLLYSSKKNNKERKNIPFKGNFRKLHR